MTMHIDRTKRSERDGQYQLHIMRGLNAEQRAHLVAPCLGCIGWGPEFYNDRDSITSGRPFLRRVDPTRQETL